MNVHHLKADAEHFDAVVNGKKTCEVRRNDRGFNVGDRLVLYRCASRGVPDIPPDTVSLEVVHITELGGLFEIDAVAMSVRPDRRRSQEPDEEPVENGSCQCGVPFTLRSLAIVKTGDKFRAECPRCHRFIKWLAGWKARRELARREAQP